MFCRSLRVAVWIRYGHHNSFCSSTAFPGGAEFLFKGGSKDTWREGPSLPAQNRPEPDYFISAWWSFLPHLLRHTNISEKGNGLMPSIAKY